MDSRIGSIDRSNRDGQQCRGPRPGSQEPRVPTILTTIGAKGSILVDPLFKELTEIFPDVTPIDRTSTHAWSHPEFRAAIDATGRKKLIMAGLVTGGLPAHNRCRCPEGRIRGLHRPRLFRRNHGRGP
jgi:hypothetical protein